MAVPVCGGRIEVQNCGVDVGQYGWPHWYHYMGTQLGPEDPDANTSHGGYVTVDPVTCWLYFEVASFAWADGAWIGDDWYGYPAALPNLAGATGTAYVKVYLAKVTGPATDIQVVDSGYTAFDDLDNYYYGDCGDASVDYLVDLGEEAITASCGPASIYVEVATGASCANWGATVEGSPAVFLQEFPPPEPPGPVPTSSCVADVTRVTLGWPLRCFVVEAGSEVQHQGYTDEYGFTHYTATFSWSEEELSVVVTAADVGGPFVTYGGSVLGSCKGCWRVALSVPRGDGVMQRVYEGGGVLWAQVSRDGGRTWGAAGGIVEGRTPSVWRDAVGGHWVGYVVGDGAEAEVRATRLVEGGGDTVTLRVGRTCPAIVPSAFGGRLHGLDAAVAVPWDLQYFPVFFEPVAGGYVVDDELAVVVTEEYDADVTPSVSEVASGRLVAAFARGGVVVQSVSTDGGRTWVE